MRVEPLPVVLVLVIALAGPSFAEGLEPREPGQGVGVRTVVAGLNSPDAFTFAPDGRIFIAEHESGVIDIYDPSTATLSVFATVTELFTDGDAGLMGVALHPQYPAQPYAYVFATRSVAGVPREQILRFRDSGGIGTQPKVIFTGNTVANGFHQGGRILFGPDGMLYAVDGDRDDPGTAQNLSLDAGKMLRLPIVGQGRVRASLVWAFGLRNSFGFAFDPMTGALWEMENGPECNDEINIVRSGKNYGWGPSETCSVPPPPPLNTNQDGPNPVLPVTYFGTPVAPVGNAFCSGCALPDSEGKMLFGEFNNGYILQATLSADRRSITGIEPVYKTGTPAGVLSMEVGPDKGIYFSDTGAIYQLVAA